MNEDGTPCSFLVIVAMTMPNGDEALVALDPARYSDPDDAMEALVAMSAATDATEARLIGWRVSV